MKIKGNQVKIKGCQVKIKGNQGKYKANQVKIKVNQIKIWGKLFLQQGDSRKKQGESVFCQKITDQGESKFQTRIFFSVRGFKKRGNLLQISEKNLLKNIRKGSQIKNLVDYNFTPQPNPHNNIQKKGFFIIFFLSNLKSENDGVSIFKKIFLLLLFLIILDKFSWKKKKYHAINSF